MKFIHAADLHLDSPLRNLQRYEGAPVQAIRSASRRALENLVELAIGEQVDFLLIAGDLFDGDWQDYNSGLFFHRHMVRLREAGIPVISISGNHDAQGKMTRSLDLTGIVHEMPTDRAATLSGDELGIDHAVAIHGRGFATSKVEENVVLDYPEPLSGSFNIGVLHTSLSGSAAHDTYAPCSPTDLINKGYDYWALGHVHTRAVVNESPPIVFPGNLQGRHIRETGPKGCYLVEVAAKRQVNLQFKQLDVFRWEHCQLEVTDCETPTEVIDRFTAAASRILEEADDLPLAMRVTLEGRCQAHAELAGDRERYVNELRAKATEIGSGRLWLEKIRIKTSLPVDAEALLTEEGPLSELSAVIKQLQTDDQLMQELSSEWSSLANRLQPILKESDSPEATSLKEPAYLRELLADVESLLIDRLSHVKEK